MVIEKVRREIARYDKPENWVNYQQFFKEKLAQPYGLKSAIMRKISNECFRDIRHLPPGEILGLCDQLLTSGERYYRGIAFEWALKICRKCKRSDFARFETWLKKYVGNWGSCDHLCIGTIGNMVLQFPELAARTMKWARSRNRWLRRAAAVSLIVPVRNGLLLDRMFQTADILLTDGDDMVQKGYGWMLKEASNRFPDEVFGYVMANRALMPRTALRYAIEKLPAAKRREAMRRE